MNRRKLCFVALAIALPLGFILPLRAARSWQPRVFEVPRDAAAPMRPNDLSALFWRSNGLLVTRPHRESWPGSIAISNWNGERVPVRILRARTASLDGQGALAALTFEKIWRRQLQMWDMDAGNNRAALAARVEKARGFRLDFNTKSALIVTPDGTRVAWNNLNAKNQSVVGIADTRTGRVLATWPLDAKPNTVAPVEQLAWSPDGAQLAVVSRADVLIIDGHSAKLVRKWRRASQSKYVTTHAQWSPDGRLLALANGDNFYWQSLAAARPVAGNRNFLWVHDARSGAPLFAWPKSPTTTISVEGVSSLSWSPDSKQLAWGTIGAQTHLMNWKTRRIERDFKVPLQKTGANPAHFVAFSPTGDTLAVANQEKLTLWRVR